MDYPDDVKYPVTCKKACEKGIIINTVQCGNDADCTKFWKDICVKAEGSFVQIPQDGGVKQVVVTPFDKRLAEINGDLARSTLVYGKAEEQAKGDAKNKEAEKLAPAAAAERAAYQAKNGQASSYDLLDGVKRGHVKLEDLKKEELPKELQDLKPAERKEYLNKLDEKRETMQKEALDLDKKRSDFIAKKHAEDAAKGTNGFDGQVLEVLRNQAKKHKIDY